MTETKSTEPTYPIKAVALKTGLTTHVIRVWEKRYSAVVPQRTDSNHRLYSESDIKKLRLLHQAIERGHNIGSIARLSSREIEELINKDLPSTMVTAKSTATTNAVQDYLTSCLRYVEELQAEGLAETLARSSISFNPVLVLDHIVLPLMQEIGVRWQQGRLKIAHEHMATAVVRTYLGNIIINAISDESAPSIVITTPIGQLHELGALTAAANAVINGWRVVYFGPNLPAEDIIKSVESNSAKAVALSIICPTEDARIEMELKKLRRFLGPDFPLFIGGRAVNSYRRVCEEHGAIILTNFVEFRDRLANISHP